MSSTQERNAAHAAVVRGWLDESLSFGQLEMAAATLDSIKEECDAADRSKEYEGRLEISPIRAKDG